jgi:hypothetical protein
MDRVATTATASISLARVLLMHSTICAVQKAVALLIWTAQVESSPGRESWVGFDTADQSRRACPELVEGDG